MIVKADNVHSHLGFQMVVLQVFKRILKQWLGRSLMRLAELAHAQECLGIPEVGLELERSAEFLGGPRVVPFGEGNHSEVGMC